MAKKKEEAVVEEAVAEEVKEVEAPVAEEKKVEAPKVLTFPKKDFVKSVRFAKHKDLVNALLDDDKKYSIKEVEDIIHNFLHGKKK